jgi:hypothetical protein
LDIEETVPLLKFQAENARVALRCRRPPLAWQ